MLLEITNITNRQTYCHHETYHARLLAKCLLASVTNDFTLTLMNRIPQELYNDGTYMLWAITNNIYCNNIALVGCIREKITTCTLSQHGNDIEWYLIYVKNHLWMIMAKPTGKKFNGLITYILCQLKGTKNWISSTSFRTFRWDSRRHN